MKRIPKPADAKRRTCRAITENGIPCRSRDIGPDGLCNAHRFTRLKRPFEAPPSRPSTNVHAEPFVRRGGYSGPERALRGLNEPEKGANVAAIHRRGGSV
jgi:hypothetical protein